MPASNGSSAVQSSGITPEEFERAAQVSHVGDNATFKVAFIRSGAKGVRSFAVRHEATDLVIHQEPTGFVGIFAGERVSKETFTSLVKLVRVAELVARGLARWSLGAEGNALFNMEFATALSPESLVMIAQTALSSAQPQERTDGEQPFDPAVLAEFAANSTFEKVGTSQGDVWIATVRSNNALMHKVARSRHGKYAAVTVVVGSDGHVSISTNHYHGLQLPWLVREIRRAELRAHGITPAQSDKELAEAGILKGVEQWIFNAEIQALYAPEGAPATRLTADAIGALVRKAVQHGTFKPKGHDQSPAGAKSVSSGGNNGHLATPIGQIVAARQAVAV